MQWEIQEGQCSISNSILITHYLTPNNFIFVMLLLSPYIAMILYHIQGTSHFLKLLKIYYRFLRWKNSCLDFIAICHSFLFWLCLPGIYIVLYTRRFLCCLCFHLCSECLAFGSKHISPRTTTNNRESSQGLKTTVYLKTKSMNTLHFKCINISGKQLKATNIPSLFKNL